VSRLKNLLAGEVRCEECKQPMLPGAAVVMNGQHLHPIGCFAPALARWRAEIDELLNKGVARHLGELASDVIRKRRSSARTVR
jgi:hypothetical protein